MFGADLAETLVLDHDEGFVVLGPLGRFPVVVLIVTGEEFGLRIEGGECPIESRSHLSGGVGELFEEQDAFPEGVLFPKGSAVVANGFGHLESAGTFHK